MLQPRGKAEKEYKINNVLKGGMPFFFLIST